MEKILFLMAVVIFVCVAFQKLLGKTGVPGLFIFILLGMLFGSDGIFQIPFDDYSFANEICSMALIFIMFYGGAGTKWSTARPAAVKAVLLSSLGTVLTAFLVGGFCFYALDFPLIEAFLMGAVICSTDAASVFSILRSKQMNLKYSTAPMLEVESGSNDPFSYMLTVLVGIALMAYTVPYLIGGNGYLSVYIAGIILGNARLPNKKNIIDFLGGLTTLMQMFLFFLLGLLSFPSKLPGVAWTALLIALFLTFIARPLAVFGILTPFRSSFRQQIFVAWSGMRGAASIVFAIMAMTGTAVLSNDIFHIVFFIVLFSILIQATFIPAMAKVLDMIDEDGNVLKTFNDYTEEVPVQFLQFTLQKGHPWEGKPLSAVTLPPESILTLILRDNLKLIPKGNTVLQEGDILILSGREGGQISGIHLYERRITKDDEWAERKLSEISLAGSLVILILRNEHVVIPNGETVLKENDLLYISDR